MNFSRPNWMNVRITARHWHYGVLVLLALINLTLVVRLIFAWDRAKAGDAASLAQHETEYRAMQLKTRPLRGLDKKIQQAKLDQEAFYEKRFPATDSEILKELGALAVKNNVLLARGQYAHGKLNQDLYELRIDTSLTGDYAPTVRFINDLERDKEFFLIKGIALNGQQNGVVSLRMLLTTYLRAPRGNSSGTTTAAVTKASATTGAATARGER